MSEDQNQEAAEAEARMAEEAKAAEQARIAAHNAHPHTQLLKIQEDLRAPGLIDVNARIGALQGALSRLIQVVLAHTPPPEGH